MRFKKFMEMYDNWNAVVRVNNHKLKTIIEEKAFVIMDTRPDLFQKQVVAFGFYDGVMTIRIKDVKTKGDNFRTVKITSGMLPEYEIIRTDAPDDVIQEQLKYIIEIENAGGVVDEPYGILESKGYKVVLLGCQDNFDDGEPKIDVWFDYYDVG